MAVITGTSNDDILLGGAGADTLSGGEGNDELYGRDGNDLLRGENGADRLEGGLGDDDLQGGDGADRLYGDGGDTNSWPGDGADRLDGGAGDDVLQAGGGNDVLLGGADSDQLTGGTGADTLDGGDGNDHLNGQGVVNFGGFDSDLDTLSGGAGDDHILATYGDSVDGGTGNDLLSLTYYSSATAGVIADFRQLANNGSVTVGGAQITNIEYIGLYSLSQYDDKVIAGARGEGWTYLEISGWAGNDELTGTAGIDNIWGGDGDDVIRGGGGQDLSIVPSGDRLRGEAGNDVIYMGDDGAEATGGTGNDTIYGGNGVDSIYGDQGNDILEGGAGNDGIDAGDGDDRVTGGAGVDYLYGRDGIDTLDYSKEDGGGDVYVNLRFGGMPGPGPDGYIPAQSALDSYGNLEDIREFENVVTGSGDDSVYGTAIANRIETGAGDDVLEGGGGADVMIGGTGNDTYWFQARDFAGAPTGTIVELAGGGIDEIATTLASFSLADVAEVENLTGYNNAGGTLTGNGLANVITGAGGADTIDGGSGDDILIGGAGNDVVDGGAGDDQLRLSGTGHETAAGAAGTDHLFVDYGDAVTNIVMTAPAAEPGGGYAGSIGDGASRQIGYSGIEIFNITTGSGNDIVRGGGNTSALPGIVSNQFSLGAGDDLFYGLGGTDTVDAGAGVDGFSGALTSGERISWSLIPVPFPGTHSVYSNFEYFLSLTTGSGQDTITTANLNLNDTITLGANSDSVYLYDGHDVVNGGAAGAGAVDSGFDTLVLNYGGATSAVRNVGALSSNAAGHSGQIGDGNTRSATFEAIDRFLVVTGTGADDITTGNGNDDIRTFTGNDVVNSGGGNDFIDGGGGDDRMTGGFGDDIYVVGSAGDVVSEDFGQGTDEVRTGLAAYTLAANVEKLTATSAVSHDFRDNGGNNVVTGGAGNDLLWFLQGGNDSGIGGLGNDVFLFGSTMDGLDLVDGGAGTDQIALQGGSAFTFGSGVVSIESLGLLSGTDTRFGGPGGLLHSYGLTTVDSNVASGASLTVDGAKLLAGEDLTFNGSAETDGSFFIYGGRGVDTLTGGAKNDVFLFGPDGHFSASDVVDGGPGGTDQLALRGNYTLTFGAGQMVGIESIGILSAHDTRFGPLGSNYSYNLTTHDDNVAAGVQMTVDGAKLRGTETLVFNGAAETNGSFRIFGGINNDILTGSQNGDILQGHGKADTLTGGGGADFFRYALVSDSAAGAADHILDFTPGTDKIDLARVDANSNAAGDQAFSWIGSSAFSGVAGQLRAYQSGNDWFVEGDVNGDGVADLVIALTLQGPAPLGAGDFLL